MKGKWLPALFLALGFVLSCAFVATGGALALGKLRSIPPRAYLGGLFVILILWASKLVLQVVAEEGPLSGRTERKAQGLRLVKVVVGDYVRHAGEDLQCAVAMAGPVSAALWRITLIALLLWGGAATVQDQMEKMRLQSDFQTMLAEREQAFEERYAKMALQYELAIKERDDLKAQRDAALQQVADKDRAIKRMGTGLKVAAEAGMPKPKARP